MESNSVQNKKWIEFYSRLYSNNDSILLIGTFPPPLGGISVHLKRLSDLISAFYKVDTFNLSGDYKNTFDKYFSLIKRLLFKKYNIVHIHSSNIKLLFIIDILRIVRKYKIFFTEHNSRLFSDAGKLKVRYLKSFITRLNCLIVVGKHIIEHHKMNNICISANTLVNSAFIPPNLKDEEDIWKSYSKATINFIDNKKPLIVANAYRLNFADGIDLYGLDLCVDMLKLLIQDFPNTGFVFALADKNYNNSYLERKISVIIESGLSDNFHLLSGQKELWPLFKKADLFIRPTNTDGDALSIREALFFKVPTIASNVCPRPKGTVLFKNRDICDLFCQTSRVINKTTMFNTEIEKG